MRFVVSGYFGFGNAGDEAILAAMVEHLREAAPDAGIAALSADPAWTERAHGVRAVDRTDLRAIARELARSDVLVSGGGGLLQDVTSGRTVPYYLGLVAMARLMGKRVFLYSQGIGPLRRPASRALVRLVVDRVDAITVRDEQSRDLLRSLGVSRPPIHVTADPAFGLSSRAPASRAREILARHGTPLHSPGPLVAVSVRPWGRDCAHLRVVASALDELASSSGAIVAHVPFHRPGDVAASEAVRELMSEGSWVLDGDYTPQEIMAIVGEADALVGMRYHSIVFAAVCGTPFVALSYDPKVDNLVAALGQEPGIPLERVDRDELVTRVATALDRREEIRAALVERSAALALRAREAARLAVQVASPTPGRAAEDGRRSAP